MAKIAYTNKVTLNTSGVAEINKVTAANMNEVKASVNALYDEFRYSTLAQFTTATSTTAYTGTTNPTITAYTTGYLFQIKAHATSTGSATLNLNAIGAKKWYTTPTTQAGTGDIVINTIYLVVYDASLDTANGGFLIVGSGGGGFTLTNGNGTTANSTAADLGGTLSAPVAIDGAQPVVFGGTTSLSAWDAYVEVGDRLHSFEMDAGIINMDVYDSVVDRGGYTYPGDYDSSGDMGVEMGAYESVGIIKFALNALTGIASLISTYAASAFNFSGVVLNLAQGSDIASATTTDIGAATGNSVTITGTTTITALGTVQAGGKRTLTFAASLTLTHNATSLILPTGANITTAAGDVAEMLSLGSGNWKCIGYMRADGTPLAGGSSGGGVELDGSFDGMGAVVLVDSIVYVRAKAAGTIDGWSIIAEGSSPTCTIDVFKIATGTTLPTASIAASALPALATGNALKSTTLTGWTTSITADDMLAFKVTACANATKIKIQLYVS